ncbi:Acyl-CoA N-acyltransferase [Kalmanozyma brasiliensis GHG001]|uniref:N-acetyltransferase domain-containing protein n=1 Tax=Kalmanozyma brasiliensis (strain GHG001) TaxID=1365824 RepID=V5EWZ9_KALBG|nr:Acyl-CoA N-acyltransferase [Kalmanozyma brasiliensis GHG001]EST07933.1 Acyl-CoA N-acyltransferase [Kalmanozyma brasiliensis GHG001]
MCTYTKDGLGRFRTAQPATGSARTLAELDVADPDESDVDFILYAFDSALPYLASIGSEAQWGTELFSQKPERRKQFTEFVQKSYDLNARQEADSNDDCPWQLMTLFEVRTEDDKWVRVAAQGLSTRFPDYVPESLASKDLRQAGDFLYLNYLIADRRKGDLAKGSAPHLISFAEQQCRKRHKTPFYGDCWRGNNDGLLKYYQKLGFNPIGPFDVKDKHGPGLPWFGYLFSKSISQ